MRWIFQGDRTICRSIDSKSLVRKALMNEGVSLGNEPSLPPIVL